MDISTSPDFDDSGRSVSPARAVMEMALRRLTTPRGSLLYDREFGFDLRSVLNGDYSTSELAALESGIVDELLKDERVASCTASVSLLGDRLRVRIHIVTQFAAIAFTLAIGDVTAEILSES